MFLIGKRLKELRITRNLTQEELGKMINVTKVSICCYEKGTRLPSLETLSELADIFNVSIDYFVGHDYYVNDNDSDIGINISKEEVSFIKEIRKYPRLCESINNNPKRIVELINKKIR